MPVVDVSGDPDRTSVRAAVINPPDSLFPLTNPVKLHPRSSHPILEALLLGGRLTEWEGLPGAAGR